MDNDSELITGSNSNFSLQAKVIKIINLVTDNKSLFLSTILIGPSGVKSEPGIALLFSKSTTNKFEPTHNVLTPMPPPITATYVSLSKLVSPVAEGILNILGVDQVSPNWL